MASGLFQKKDATGIWWRDHSLSIILAAIMAAQTGLAVWSGGHVWRAIEGAKGSFWIWWIWEYNVSLVADSFGVLLIVLLSKWFREVGSAESNK